MKGDRVMAVGDPLKLGLNYNTKLEINTTPYLTPPADTWVRLCKGFANIAESLNEVLYQASYLCDEGWGSTEVTGGQWTITLTGVRYYNDAAQEYIFSEEVQYRWGDARRTQLRVTRGNEVILQWDVTLANITESGGDSNAPVDITVTIHGNGAPYVPEITVNP